MSQKCNTLQGSSTTARSLKVLCGERANELGGTQGETERRQKFLRAIFAFITLETTKVIGRVLPSTNHLLFYDGPCDLSVASSCFDDTQISFFSSKNSDTKIFFAAPLQSREEESRGRGEEKNSSFSYRVEAFQQSSKKLGLKTRVFFCHSQQ